MTSPRIVVVDANVLIAALVDSDTNHVACASYVKELGTPLLVSVLALTEVAHFLEKYVGPQAEIELIGMVLEGELLPIYDGAWWGQIHELAAKYVDNKLGMVDASLFIAAEHAGTLTIASTDKLHRSIVTPRTPWFIVEPGI